MVVLGYIETVTGRRILKNVEGVTSIQKNKEKMSVKIVCNG